MTFGQAFERIPSLLCDSEIRMRDVGTAGNRMRN